MAQVLSLDSVTVAVDAVVYYRVEDAAASVGNVENAHVATRLLAQSILRNVLGARPLAEMLAARDSVSAAMQETLDEATQPWGIQVERVEMCASHVPLPFSSSNYSYIRLLTYSQ